jgi:hypothetical protein
MEYIPRLTLGSVEVTRLILEILSSASIRGEIGGAAPRESPSL